MVDTRSTRVCVYGKIKYHTATRDVSLNHCVAIRFAYDAYQDIDFRSFVSKRLVNNGFLRLLVFQWDRFSHNVREPAKARRRLVKNSHLCARYGRGGGREGEQRGKLKWTLHICIYIYTSKDLGAIYFTRSIRAGIDQYEKRRWQLCKSDLKC